MRYMYDKSKKNLLGKLNDSKLSKYNVIQE